MNKDYAADNTDKIATYVHNLFKPEDPILADIRQRATQAGLPSIHVGRMDGLHLEVLKQLRLELLLDTQVFAYFAAWALKENSTLLSTNPSMPKSLVKLSRKQKFHNR
jgi:hypothetical protein